MAMGASPFQDNHTFLLESFSNSHPVTSTSTAAATTTAVDFCEKFHMQPHVQVLPTSFGEVIAHGNQAPMRNNNPQSSNSSMSMEFQDHKLQRRMPTTSSSFKHAQSNDMAKRTCKRQKKNKKDEEKNKKKMKENGEGENGYIHVRARRGEATDSHSLAERVRREKISERMKALQSIVPGCDKITGKALMLDEVINYVKSLQNEIQILSLKLAAVNPILLYDLGADFDAFLFKPDQNMSNNQQQMLLFQESEMPCLISQNNGQTLWDLDEPKQELYDPFAIINNFNSFY